MQKSEVLAAHRRISHCSDPDLYLPIHPNPFYKEGKRPNSVYIGDSAFGDSGKGIMAAEFNRMLRDQYGIVFSLRFNGGANAGHHMFIDGREFLVNQLPAAVAQEGAIAIITRGVFLHPGDAVLEINRTAHTFGGEMPGELIIDPRAPLVLDTHRVEDTIKGSTGRGMGPAVGDFYVRRELTVKDLMGDNWAGPFKEHYDYKKAIIEATLHSHIKDNGYNGAEDFPVKRLDNSTYPLGTKDQFLSRLEADRRALRQYVYPNIRALLRQVWAEENMPMTFEEAQGPGLDPFFGIRPDVTSTRPHPRSVYDGSWGVINPDQIAVKVGVSKTVYMSSVGARWLPGEMSEGEANYYHSGFGEFGKTTGRKRGIYHVSLPLMQSLRDFAGYDYLVATHIDAARNNPIKLVSHYTDTKTNWEGDYSPYQDEIDNLEAHYIEMPGWDGIESRSATTPTELDLNARRFLALLSETVAPILMVRNGTDLGNNIKFWAY